MKKIYLSAAAVLACTFMNAQAFWTNTNYRGAFPVTDNTAATDWTSGWSNFDPENTAYGAPTTTVSTDVASNTTWSGIICLKNKIYVKNNAVLTIQPGTIIRGDKTTQGSLIITRGAQINAAGTMASPIIFTSNEAVGFRAEGDWGGVVLLGKAVNNQPGGVANIEGISPTIDTEFGGTIDNDNSGVLKFVRIEFAGIALQPNKEINGLTLGSVGSATQMDHIQVSFSGDDSYEWFGGTVDAKWLIAYRGLDDDFDCDFGFRGRIQFGLIIRDKDLSDAIGDSNSWECDNDGIGSSATPLTKPVFSNITTIGPKGNGSIALPTGEKFEKSFRLRRNSAVSVFNSISTGWEKGLSIEAANTESNYTSNAAFFSNNILTNYAAGTKVITAPLSFYSTFFGANGNDSTTTIAQVNWVNAFPALGTTPDLRLNTASTASAGASFTNSVFSGGFVGLSTVTKFSNKVVSVYPNPASDISILAMNAINSSNVNINIYDVTGKLVSTIAKNIIIEEGYNEFKINTSNIPSGIYFVTLESAVGKETVKLMVTK